MIILKNHPSFFQLMLNSIPPRLTTLKPEVGKGRNNVVEWKDGGSGSGRDDDDDDGDDTMMVQLKGLVFNSFLMNDRQTTR